MSKDLSAGLLRAFLSVEKLSAGRTFYNAHPMIPTRRAFLQTGSAMLGMGMAHGSLTSADEQTLALPPSIATLKSMKDQARPIRPEERLARQEKARSLMEANDLDAILLMEGTSLNYFTGIRWWGGSFRVTSRAGTTSAFCARPTTTCAGRGGCWPRPRGG